MKRTPIFFLVLLLAVVGSTYAFAGPSGMRVGGEFGNPTFVGIFRWNIFDFKVGYDFTGFGTEDSNSYFLFFSGDIRILDAYSFGNFPLTLFLGVGAFVQINNVGGDSTGEIATQLGLRIPVGLSLWLFKNVLEIFVEVVPTINIIPDLSAFRSWQGWVGFTIALPW